MGGMVEGMVEGEEGWCDGRRKDGVMRGGEGGMGGG